MKDQFPLEGMALTHILVVSDLDRARSFYRDVLGAKIYGEYGGTSIVFDFNGVNVRVTPYTRVTEAVCRYQEQLNG